MIRFFKQLWTDPVWSKVIAAAIIALAASIYSAMNALYHNESFVSGFVGFWGYKLPVWAYAIFTVVIAAVFILSPRAGEKHRNSSIDQKKKGASIIFQSAKAEPYEYQLKETKIRDQDEKRQFGENGRDKMNFKSGILSIHRSNIDGSVIVQLIKYLNGTGKADYIKSDLSGSPKRILDFTCECRVIGGRHQLEIVVLRKDGTWITSKRFDIASEQWEPVQDYLVDIPATEDFVIAFEDSLVERENSSIQLRNIKIEEIIN